MRSIEIKGSDSTRYPRTAKELVHVIGTNLSTLNPDINLTRRMPPILPGDKGVRDFVEALRQSLFPNIADTIQTVHVGEKRFRRGKRFPSRDEAMAFSTASAVLADMAYAVGNNAQLLDRHMTVVPERCYRGGQTKVGELVLTFYELMSDNRHAQLAYPGAYSLSQLPHFTLSPLMHSVITLQEMDLQEVVSRDQVRTELGIIVRSEVVFRGALRTVFSSRFSTDIALARLLVDVANAEQLAKDPDAVRYLQDAGKTLEQFISEGSRQFIQDLRANRATPKIQESIFLPLVRQRAMGRLYQVAKQARSTR